MHASGGKREREREMQSAFKMLNVFIYYSTPYSLNAEFPDHIPRTIHWNGRSPFKPSWLANEFLTSASVSPLTLRLQGISTSCHSYYSQVRWRFECRPSYLHSNWPYTLSKLGFCCYYKNHDFKQRRKKVLFDWKATTVHPYLGNWG